MPISRREFLSYAAGLAGSALPISRLRAQPRFDKYPYTLGVASGHPDEGGFVLWTRLAPEPLAGGGMPPAAVEVGWEVAADESFRNIVRRGTEIASPDWAHSVRAEVTGLEPGRWYFYRFHAGAKKRAMRRELRMAPAVGPGATSIALVDRLVASGVTPSGVLAQGEMQGALLQALEGMEAIDREVLALRHFEELDNAEVARVLEIPPNTASKRYVRALERLAKIVKGGALGAP